MGCVAVLKKPLFLITVALAMTGCMTTPPQPAPPPKIDADVAIERANAFSVSGQNAQALSVLDQAARDNPVNAKPWLRKAQLQFEQSDYPSAIVSAEEAVKRDPTSQDARSVAIVASLRIAIRSLTELRGEQNLNSNAQQEAERLAKVLRDSLSTDVLVPPQEPPAKKAPPKQRTAKRAPPAEKPDIVAPAPPSGDPFGALR
jgi:Tfp pilus assembly protein PilF